MVDEGEPLLAAILRFVALLRRLGITVGTGQALDAARALTLVDLAHRDDVYAALRAVLLDAHAHEPAFAAAFERFWSGLAPLIEEQASSPLGYAPAPGPRPRGEGGEDRTATAERVLLLAGGDDLMDEGDAGMSDASKGQAVAYSASEALRHRDFAHLTPRELAEMRRLLADLAFTPPLRRLRRSEAARGGPLLDLRRVARRNLRYGGEVLVLPRRRRKQRPRPLALLCDVSGSMDRYTRLLLRFLHATTQGLEGVETFVFGTRLTRITHQLRLRDPDRALDEVARDVLDFAGGTRIGEAIATFNRRWARRVLGRGAIAVIISDGWDRGDPALLAAEMAHLQRSCHLLVWLNPLLGLEGYQPLTRGMSAALPYVDLFLPAHNLASLEALAAMLGRIASGRPARGGSTGLLAVDGRHDAILAR
jgi:uncharacterized protein with von Willebrand factor type A (vWA) domain